MRSLNPDLLTCIPALEGGDPSLLALTNLFPMNDVGTRREIRLGCLLLPFNVMMLFLIYIIEKKPK